MSRQKKKKKSSNLCYIYLSLSATIAFIITLFSLVLYGKVYFFNGYPITSAAWTIAFIFGFCGLLGLIIKIAREGFGALIAKCEMCGKVVAFDGMRYYVHDFEGTKHSVCKACTQRAKGKALKFDPKSQRVIVVDRRDIEIRKQCNVCGKIFCYNPMDLAKNKQKANMALLSAVGSLGGAMSGHYAASAVHQGNASNEMNQIVDYDKCPKCGSLDLRIMSKEEFLSAMKRRNAGTMMAGVAPSSADEIKKYKELLDMGVITQAEFDAKKKQLLGL